MNLQENIKKEFDAAKDKVQFLNDLRKYISSLSPEKVNPVDCVLWVDKDMVVANNYNPNHVADKEMRLLYIREGRRLHNAYRYHLGREAAEVCNHRRFPQKPRYSQVCGHQ